jgi:trehalose 6-phosphate phosphatase
MTAPAPLIEAVQQASAVLLYLDYDGTLVPLRRDPSHCAIAPQLATVLRRLSERQASPALDLAVISGRSLADLRAQLGPGLEHLALAGNHGLEIASGGTSWCDPRALALVPQLDGVAERLRDQLISWPGARLEHKGLSLSLHSRGLSALQRQGLIHHLQPLLAQIHREGQFVLRRGRMVLEVRPAILHTKADAVQWLEAAARRRGVWSAADPAEPLRLYVGDDDTDEDVFRLWPGVVGVRVGPGAPHTAASYRLSGPAGVARWLEGLDRQLAT